MTEEMDFFRPGEPAPLRACIRRGGDGEVFPLLARVRQPQSARTILSSRQTSGSRCIAASSPCSPCPHSSVGACVAIVILPPPPAWNLRPELKPERTWCRPMPHQPLLCDAACWVAPIGQQDYDLGSDISDSVSTAIIYAYREGSGVGQHPNSQRGAYNINFDTGDSSEVSQAFG